MQIESQEQWKAPTEGSNAYSLFLYAVRSKVTRDYYLRRLRAFFDHIDLLLTVRWKNEQIFLLKTEYETLVRHSIVS